MMDTGLHSLVAIARFYQLPAEPDQLAHEFCEPGSSFSDTQILQAAKALTLKAKSISLTISTLKSSVLPAIAKHKDGSYFIIARLAENSSDENSPQVKQPEQASSQQDPSQEHLSQETPSKAKTANNKTKNKTQYSGALIHY